MKTEALIRALAQDAGRPVVPVNRLVAIAWLAGASLSLLLFALLLHPRPDISSAMGSAPFCFKVAVVACVALTAAGLLGPLARPMPSQRRLSVLALGPVLLAAGLAIELNSFPFDTWQSRLIGRNAVHCVSLIPLLSAAPAICLLMALRRGAPARPGLAGAIAGLAAGGFGAILYAFTCPDDSPLFIAAWYSLAISVVTAACFLAGRRWLSW